MVLFSATFGTVTLGTAEEPSSVNQEPLRFQTDILPLLSNRCFRCHGPDAETREAGLRLDDPTTAVAELDSGSFAIVRGDLEKSELVQRIVSDDEDLQMPPPDSGTRLTADEQEMLKRWVAEGAAYEKHWSFVVPTQPEIPQYQDTWIRNSIDPFVLDRLDSQQIEPQDEAEPHRLARRASLAITGLPPTPDGVESFVNSSHPRRL